MAPNSRKILAALAVTGALLGAAPASAQRPRRREATPNIGFIFPGQRAPSDSAVRVAAALRRYNRTEQRLFAAPTVAAREISAHWRTLSGLRIRLERLELADRLDDDPKLHDELVTLLEHPLDVGVVGDGPAEEMLRRAADLRLSNLVAIARLANRRLGFHIREVLGMPVDAGES